MAHQPDPATTEARPAELGIEAAVIETPAMEPGAAAPSAVEPPPVEPAVVEAPASPTVDPLAEALDLLLQAGFSADIEQARQVYVNRDLRMSHVGWIGFDMDYTLARYYQEALDALSVKHTVDTLVDKLGYPASIRAIEPDPDFAIRGLVVDKQHGNILKLDSHHYVGRAYHGMKPVAREVKRAYNDVRLRMQADRYVLVDTLFSLPEAFLYAALVDHLEASESQSGPIDYTRLYDDVRAAIDLAHADGRIKREILTDISGYVIQDRELAATLHGFRSAGKHLFLLTNSEQYYTQAIMSYLLDGVDRSYPSWRNYFDVIITSASKPGFFRGAAPFVRLDDGGQPQGEERTGLERGRLYAGGNLADFMRMLGVRGSEVLYVGDHIYGDIVRSKRDSAWRTAMIIQEMEDELSKHDRMREEMDRWAELDQQLAELNADLSSRKGVLERLEQLVQTGNGWPPERQAGLDRARRELKRHMEQLDRRRRDVLSQLIELDGEISKSFNPYWGFLFKEGSEHSVFGGQVEDYACVYTSRVSNFRRYSPMRYFRARQQRMPHEY